MSTESLSCDNLQLQSLTMYQFEDKSPYNSSVLVIIDVFDEKIAVIVDVAVSIDGHRISLMYHERF